MEANKTTLERVFELARSGQFANLTELRLKLRSEGYNLQQLEGSSLSKQLTEIMRTARRDV